MPRNAECQRCPLHVGVTNRCIWGHGNPNAKIVLVGEGPGESEDKTGLPFQGAAGRVLDNCLVKAGLSRDDVYITNIVKCVVGSTPIGIPTTASIGYRRHYEGPVVLIKTASGHELTVTPNHPVLTGRGWIPAKDLDIRSDHVYRLVTNSPSSVIPNIQNMPASAEEIFDSLQGSFRRIIGTINDFHGDGIRSYINIVRSFSNLTDSLDSDSVEAFNNFNLLNGLFRQPSFVSSSSTDRSFGNSIRTPQLSTVISGTPSLCSELYSVLESSCLPISSEGIWHDPALVGLNLGSSRDSSVYQPSSNSLRTDTELAAYLCGRQPREIESDCLVYVKQDWFSGHVYNFSTPEGWYTADTIITHNCRPPANRAPTIAEAKTCFSYLAEEIDSLHPKVVVALGGSAIKLLSGRDSIVRARGSFLEPAKGVRLNGAKLLATFHPAAYLHSRNPGIFQNIADDLRFAANAAKDYERGKALPEHLTTFLPPGYSSSDLEDALAQIAEAKVVAMDCEWTYATDRRIAWPWTKGAELYSIALSGRVDGKIVSVGISQPMKLDSHAVLAGFLEGRKVVFHNAMADLIWLHNLKLPIKLAGDTMLLAYLFSETADLKLATLAETWVGLENWKQPLWKNRPQAQEAWDELLSYNCDDTHATLLLMEKLWAHLLQLPEQEQTDLRRLYFNLLLPATPMFVRMAIRGIPLSLKRVERMERFHTKRLAKMGAVLAESTGRKVEQAIAMANSPDQVKAELRSAYGLEADTTNAYVMEQLADQYPVCRMIQDVKHQTKLLGTYLRPWIQLLREQGDGRLHSVYSIVRTVTGRTATQTELGAAIQLVTRELWMHQCFYTELGYILDSIDQSQLEMRIAALVAGERTLLGLFQKGYDPHRFLAGKITGHSMTDESYWHSPIGKKARQDAKPAGFGFLYGMQAEKFRLQAKKDYGIDYSLEEAQAIRTMYYVAYPDFLPWYKRCEQQFLKGFVRTMFGQYRRFLPDSNKVSNTYVQTPSTQLVMLSLIEMDRYLVEHPELNCELVGFVHDSGLLLRPNTPEGKAAAAKMAEFMKNPPVWKLGVDALDVPLEAEIKSGRRWK